MSPPQRVVGGGAHGEELKQRKKESYAAERAVL